MFFLIIFTSPLVKLFSPHFSPKFPIQKYIFLLGVGIPPPPLLHMIFPPCVADSRGKEHKQKYQSMKKHQDEKHAGIPAKVTGIFKDCLTRQISEVFFYKEEQCKMFESEWHQHALWRDRTKTNVVIKFDVWQVRFLLCMENNSESLYKHCSLSWSEMRHTEFSKKWLS